METGTALARALYHTKLSNCHLINMSYGESCSLTQSNHFNSRLSRLIDELVNQHNVTFVSSAGNNGPALSTVGAPGGIFPSTIGVGAYVTGGMMTEQYNLPDELPNQPYTWTSRGPTPDGDLGVSVTSCGAAITCVPQWTLSKNQRMNGTSMSSPHACGGIALVMSGLKQRGLEWNPHWMKQALTSTASQVNKDEPFSTGHGLVQVDSCFDWLMNHSIRPYRYLLKCEYASSRCDSNRGIYLREPDEISHVSFSTVTVDVKVRESIPDAKHHADLLNLNQLVHFESSHPEWITCPKSILLSTSLNQFNIKVDPTLLTTHGHYYGCIKAFDSSDRSYGPLFTIPVTVIKPVPVSPLSQTVPFSYSYSRKFTSGQIHREFLVPPRGARYVTCKLTTLSSIDTKREYVVHSIQLLPKQSYEKAEFHKAVVFSGEHDQWQSSWKVHPEVTLELCVARNWSRSGDSDLKIELEWKGITVEPSSIVSSTHQLVQSVQIKNECASSEVECKVELDRFQRVILPSSNAVEVQSDPRNTTLDGSGTVQAIIDYKFTLDAAFEKCSLHVPVLNTLLYESPFESQMIMLFNSNQEYMGVFDAFEPKNAVKLAKGDYVAKLQIRHEKLSSVNDLLSYPIVFNANLPKKISVNLYDCVQDAYCDAGKKTTKSKLNNGRNKQIYLSLSSFCKQGGHADLKDVKPDVLKGRFTYHKDIKEASVGVTITVDNSTKKGKEDTIDVDSMHKKYLKTIVDFIKEAIKNKKYTNEQVINLIQTIPSFDKTEDKDLDVELYRLDLLLSYALERDEPSINTYATKLLESIDEKDLIMHFGMMDKTEPEQTENVDQSILVENKLYNKRKELYMNAVRALVEHVNPDGDTSAQYQDALQRYKRWFSKTDKNKLVLLEVQSDKKKGYYGSALDKLNKAIKDAPKNEKELFETRLKLIEEMGEEWHCWKVFMQNLKAKKYPKSYRLF